MSDAAIPEISFPAQLPVSAMRDTIATALSANQVIIVAGETGSGKTTQLPKIALSIGRKAIVHTQPRRIAARAVAERIAAELGSELGAIVGYQVRFTALQSAATKIKLVTDGILLNEIHHDRLLSNYDTIIIDEAHERSLNIDFLLGYLRTILPRRPDLKVIITSATIDPASFAQHFADKNGVPAPIIEVSGRSFPVEIRYRAWGVDRTAANSSTGLNSSNGANSTAGTNTSSGTASTTGTASPTGTDSPAGTASPTSTDSHKSISAADQNEAVCAAAAELLRDSSGDILAFFAGEGEIRDAQEALAGFFNTAKNRLPRGEKLEILPLYGRLSAAEQHRVFSPTPPGSRRIVLATNVAETSLTVPNITGVIDTGTARVSRYSAKSKVQRLPLEPIAQANAIQRAGRAGRLSPGIAIRLYSEADFHSRPLFTDPEILRTGLASVLLQMYALRFGDVQKFPFLTAPDQRGVRDGIALLSELQAIHKGRLTPLGQALAQLPLEPRFARMLVTAKQHGISDKMIPLVAGLTIADVREVPEADREKALASHKRFADPLGDLHTLLNLYEYLQKLRQELGSSAFRRRLKAEYLHALRVHEWFDLVRQLERSTAELRLPRSLQKATAAAPADPAQLLLFCALTGLLSHLGTRDELATQQAKYAAKKRSTGRRGAPVSYLGSRGMKFTLHPSSVLAAKPPEAVMSVELVETSRLFARNNAIVELGWAEDIAGKLAKRSYSSPHWALNKGAAMINERVTLYGVTLVAERAVPLARIDAALAREIFIREALVAQSWKQNYPFLRHNAQLRNKLANLEQQARVRGLVGDDEAVYEFYAARLPAQVYSTTSFEAWWHRVSKQQPRLLHLSEQDLLSETAQQQLDSDAAQYPRVWSFGEQQLQLRYRFDPTAVDDGVTVVVPLPLLPQLAAEQFVQLVPGMRHELVTALLKTLPKNIRKHVVPAAAWATKFCTELEPQLSGAATTGNQTATAGHTAGERSTPPNSADTSLTTLLPLLAKAVQQHASLPVLVSDFELSRLPSHLRPTFRVVDTRGRTIASGKELAALQQQHAVTSTRSVAATAAQQLPPQQQLSRTGLTSWPTQHNSDALLSIPPRLTAQLQAGRGSSAGTVTAFPALVDRGKTVDLKLFSTAAAAQAKHRFGVARLVQLSTPPVTSYLQDHLTQQEKLLLAYSPYRTVQDLFYDLTYALALDTVTQLAPDGTVYAPQQFQNLVQRFEQRIVTDSFALVTAVAQLCEQTRTAQKAIDNAKSLTVLPLVADAKEQLGTLIYASAQGRGFISDTGLQQLPRLSVYLRALTHRMQQLPAQAGRDSAALHTLRGITAEFIAAGGSLPLPPQSQSGLVTARWMLEELRVSLYAQQLGTAGKVSVERIRKQLAELQ